jgi:hypothetical protein
MWLPAEIVLQSYLPSELEEGMLFVNRISVGVIYPYIEVWELKDIPEDMDEFLSRNGAPVKFAIIDIEDEEIIATHDELGWWEQDGEVRELTLEDINYLFNDFDGYVEIEIDDEELSPLYIDDMVILSIQPELEEEEEEDE